MTTRFETQCAFLKEAEDAFGQGLLVVIRWSRAAGARDYAYFTSLDAFKSACQKVPSATNIIVFPEAITPITLAPDENSMHGNLAALINPGHEFLILEDATDKFDWSNQAAPYNLVADNLAEVAEYGALMIGRKLLLFTSVPEWDTQRAFEYFAGNVVGIY